MNQKKADKYSIAARWLGKVKGAYSSNPIENTSSCRSCERSANLHDARKREPAGGL